MYYNDEQKCLFTKVKKNLLREGQFCVTFYIITGSIKYDL